MFNKEKEGYIMKKMLTALFALCIVGTSVAVAADNSTFTERWINKKANELAKPVADKERELQAKQEAAEKARAAKEAEYRKQQREAARAQRERQKAREAKQQQVQNDVNNLKNSIDAFKKYKK